jgi:hypothetical protein
LNAKEILDLYNSGWRTFRNQDWRGVDLSGEHLEHIDMAAVDLRGANLAQTNMSNATISVCDFRHASMEEADLRFSELRELRLYHTNMNYASLDGCKLVQINFTGADLRWMTLAHTSVRGCKGIISIYVPDMSSRGDFLFAWRYEQEIWFKAGCFNGNAEELRAQVINEKGEESTYLKAIDFVMGIADTALPVAEDDQS